MPYLFNLLTLIMNKNILRIITIPERIRNMILFKIFKFDKWHTSPSGNRVYPKDIIIYTNNLKNIDSVCEIGCGLGDIISNIKATKRIGFDLDLNVLKAASWLHKRKTNLNFDYFLFPDSLLQPKFDVIIAVNWLHNIDNDSIKKNFIKYFTDNLNVNGILIVDAIDNPNYKYHHNFYKYFDQTRCEILELGDYQSNRKVLIIQKVNDKLPSSQVIH